jgi:BMFP domain-containing protein YqiC
LVNLVTQYGTQVQKKYPQAISEATTRVSEPQRLVLQANKTQLDVYMKRKETTIDIAQQVL